MTLGKPLETLARCPLSFYERFYRPEALSETQRRHRELWHS